MDFCIYMYIFMYSFLNQSAAPRRRGRPRASEQAISGFRIEGLGFRKYLAQGKVPSKGLKGHIGFRVCKGIKICKCTYI